MTDREKLAPYLADLKAAVAESGLRALPGFDCAVFAAQGFRESDWTWAPGYTPHGDPRGTGDGGHGHGLFQIDDRTYGDVLRKIEWWKPLENMRLALGNLRGNRLYFKSLSHMPGVDEVAFLRLVLSAFNCGPNRARKGLLYEGDPDHFTASRRKDRKGDYSAWILAKAADLRVQIPELNEAVA